MGTNRVTEAIDRYRATNASHRVLTIDRLVTSELESRKAGATALADCDAAAIEVLRALGTLEAKCACCEGNFGAVDMQVRDLCPLCFEGSPLCEQAR